MLEKEFQANVIELAQTCGWKVHHARPAWSKDGERITTAIQGDAGFPDLVLARAGRIIFAELKTEKGRLAPKQAEWLTELAGEWSSNQSSFIGASNGRLIVAVWRPADMQRIAEILSPRYR